MSGTDRIDLGMVRYSTSVWCYARPGTKLAYAATRCAVLSYGTGRAEHKAMAAEIELEQREREGRQMRATQ
eukprot:2001785-Rhodomonas_salina.1